MYWFLEGDIVSFGQFEVSMSMFAWFSVWSRRHSVPKQASFTMPPSSDASFYRNLSIALGTTSTALLYLLWTSRTQTTRPTGLALLSTHPPGPSSILSSENVTTAPPETMDMSCIAPGLTQSHRDARGGIYKLRIASNEEEPGMAGQGTTVNAYFTRKGHKRSGDLHKVTQYDVLLTGRARLKVLDPSSGREEIVELVPNVLVGIPPYRPHVFEFLEDCSMLEWWDGAFEAFYYTPYRKEISETSTRLLGGGGSNEH